MFSSRVIQTQSLGRILRTFLAAILQLICWCVNKQGPQRDNCGVNKERALKGCVPEQRTGIILTSDENKIHRADY